MKKFLAAAVAAVMALGVMTGCSSTSEEPAENNEATEEGAEAGERTTFTVGFDAEYPPYGYMAEEAMSALTLTLLRKYATETVGNL